jgi:hypothetical protein
METFNPSTNHYSLVNSVIAFLRPSNISESRTGDIWQAVTQVARPMTSDTSDNDIAIAIVLVNYCVTICTSRLVTMMVSVEAMDFRNYRSGLESRLRGR